MKMPALQFYPADWRKDLGVQSLGYFERGVWFEMLCLMHESEERGVLLLNGQPMTNDVLAKILGLDNQILESCLTVILARGVARTRGKDGALFSKRMVEDEKLCEVRRKAGKMGGNPALLNQNQTTRLNQNPTPSSSSSSSASTSVKHTRARAAFVAPSLEEWRAYGQTLIPPYPANDADNAFDFYVSKGWKVGNSPMKDWQAACRTCHRRWNKQQAGAGAAFPMNDAQKLNVLRKLEAEQAEYTDRDKRTPKPLLEKILKLREELYGK